MKLKKPAKNGDKGFTLVELLVVIALLGISIGVTNDILVSLIRSYNKTQVKNEIEQQANFVGLKLERELRSSTGAIVAGGAANTITIQKSATENVTYSLNGDFLTMQKNTWGPTVYPLTINTGVGRVIVRCNINPVEKCFTMTTNDPPTVLMHIKIESATNSSDFSNIINAITIRDKY